MIGITKIIKKIFAPTFNYKKIVGKKQSGGLKKRAACKRGQQIDLELQSFVENKTSNFCKETILLLNKFKELDWTLKQSQYYVVDDELRMCGFVDLIAFDNKNQKTIVVETKRGCKNRDLGTKDGVFKFQENLVLSDCLRNQHEMQALLGKKLYEKTTSSCCLSCLIYVDEKEILFIPEDQFRVQINDIALTAIKNFKKKSSKKRKRL